MWYAVKKLVRIFFFTLGVIFFLLIGTGMYLWYVDPFELRPLVETLLSDAKGIATEVREGVEEKVGEDKSPSLNAVQERALEAVGIDPAKIPATMTPEQEVCFTEKLGAARVAEIRAGASPSAADLLKARSCID